MELDSFGFIGIQLIKKLIKIICIKQNCSEHGCHFSLTLKNVCYVSVPTMFIDFKNIYDNIGSHDDIREDRMAWEKGFDPVFRKVRISVGTIFILWNHWGWHPLELACSVKIFISDMSHLLLLVSLSLGLFID